MIRCTSFRKKIFYTKVYMKKHVKIEGMKRGNGDREGEESTSSQI